MIKDRFRLRRDLHKKVRRGDLAKKIERSVKQVEQREEAAPTARFPDELPISAHVEEITSAIRDNQVVVIAGETGSGKTTQIPKICLEMGRGVYGMIGHTQPRRVAARTLAHRIAEELDVEPGKQVGYQVRFTDKSEPGTHVKIMTDGILLAETQGDKFLERYDTLIIDEAHERSLNIDFLLGYIKRILPRRPDLKVIITSATIDVERFSRHFNKAPVIEVSGRTWPVTVHYRPPETSSKSGDSDELMYEGVLDTLAEILDLEKQSRSVGDVLVFLSGEREIREVGQKIRRSNISDKFEVLPLYSRLSVSEQNRIFAPHQGRRVVLATNVAETSLTVPGIRYVIDTGVARISRYSVRSGVQRLPVEPISKASAEQRKGRCGRVSEGVCFRLYSEEDYESRPEFTPPEILRTNLASVILQMLFLRLGDMSKFPFVEKPDQRQINDGFNLLKELQAVDGNKKITRLGKDMARMPVDLRLARMLIAAGKSGCLQEVLIIVSALSVQDPRERPYDHQQAADEAHRRHWHEASDFMAFVNLWNFYEETRQQLSQNQLRKFCRQHFLSFLRMREWRDTHRQLRLLCKEMNLKENYKPSDYASIHRALLTGLLSNIGERGDENEYMGARNRKHYIFPGSSQFKSRPRWIMSAELVETTRLYARTVAGIESDWIESLAGHLVRRNYYEPHFDVDRGQVLAFEEVSLYGLVVVKKRQVDFGAIDPVRARQIFIQSGLVEQQLSSDAAFYRHNKKLIREVEKMESKARKRDILVDSYALYQFYDERLPAQVCSVIDLDQWRAEAEKKNPKLLYLDKDYLIKQHAELSETLYPDTLEVADTRLKLDYHFDPRHEEDGVSVNVPRAVLRQVSRAQLEWVIPGLLRDKCLALIKSLPKSLRKNFVPAPDYVDRVIDKLEYDGRPLTEVLSERLFRETGIRVPADAFDSDAIDRHLNLNIRVLDERGKVMGSGRNLDSLVSQFAGQGSAKSGSSQGHRIESEGLTDWDFDELPGTIEFKQAGVRVKGYPALVDQGETVSIKVMDNPYEAEGATEQGLLRLILSRLGDQRKYIEKNIPGFDRFALYYATRGSRSDLLNEMVEAIFRYTFIEDKPAVRTKAEFEVRLQERQQLVPIMNRVAELVGETLPVALEIEETLKTSQTDLNKFAYEDIGRQLDGLMGPGFITRVPLRWLAEYPRFMKAIAWRLEKMQGNFARDRDHTMEIARVWERYANLPEQERRGLQRYRWMVEEYRVSLFAQPLGTSIPVSGKRLDREWEQSVTSVHSMSRH